MRTVAPVTTRRDRRRFVGFPYVRYADDPHWVPPLRRDEYRRLAPTHPFLAHAEMQLWLSTENGHVTGRIAAIDDRLHDETHGEAVSWFGFLEAADQSSAVSLLAAVEQHARSRGSTAMRGPVNPSLNESAGLLVDGFDADPSVLMPYNPPEYAGWVEAFGCRKVKDLLAWHLDLGSGPCDRIVRMADRVARRPGITIRPISLVAFDRELQTLRRLYERAWRDNWGFVAPTEAEMRQAAGDLRPIVDPEVVLLAELHGEPVGCAVAIPNINRVLRLMRGRLLPFGIVHFLRRRAIVDDLRVLLLGVDPSARLTGLYPLLIAELQRRAVARGYRSAELSWTLEDNDAVNAGIEAAGARRSKTYRLYEKPLR
jgi:GNAT superfamily N-acetyltransferase